MRDYTNLLPAFVALLALGGQIGLPILVLTCLRSKRLNRHPTFVNCCVTAIIYSLVFCILLSRVPVLRFASSPSDRPAGFRIYTGQYRRAEPNHALCVVQASMVMAVLPMCDCPGLTSLANIDALCRVCVAVLMFILQVHPRILEGK
jgi:hypothetical protein